jgi:hypothetical protein
MDSIPHMKTYYVSAIKINRLTQFRERDTPFYEYRTEHRYEGGLISLWQ